MKTILERAEDILNLPAIKSVNETPEWMPNQKKLIEFAQDAALYIIASHQPNTPDPKEKPCPKS